MHSLRTCVILPPSFQANSAKCWYTRLPDSGHGSRHILPAAHDKHEKQRDSSAVGLRGLPAAWHSEEFRSANTSSFYALDTGLEPRVLGLGFKGGVSFQALSQGLRRTSRLLERTSTVSMMRSAAYGWHRKSHASTLPYMMLLMPQPPIFSASRLRIDNAAESGPGSYPAFFSVEGIQCMS